MKTIRVLILFTLCSLYSWGQKTENQVEFGSTLLTINSLQTPEHYPQLRAPVELLNGIFFRFHKNRLAIRALSSYSENFSNYSAAPDSFDIESGEVKHKDFRIGLGIQHNLLKNKNWLYLFGDLSYRNVFTEGLSYGGLGGNYSYYSTGNGFDLFLGLGGAFLLIKNLCISPELGYLINYNIENQTSVMTNTGYTYSGSTINTNVSPLVKLHLTAKL